MITIILTIITAVITCTITKNSDMRKLKNYFKSKGMSDAEAIQEVYKSFEVDKAINNIFKNNKR